MRAQDIFKAVVVMALSSLVSGAPAADIDREPVDFTTPGEHTAGVKNPTGTNEQVILY